VDIVIVYQEIIENLEAMENRRLVHPTRGRHLENMMVKERNQPQNIMSCMAPFMCNVQKRKIYTNRR
jgi:tRNA1(Val) A37 N6-methylase TrmN6